MDRATRLLNRNFVLLWQGQLISRLGDQAFAVAVVFWLKDATESASLIGLLLMLSGIPAVLLGPVGGSIADRYSRRRLIILNDLISGIAVLSLAAVTFWQPAANGMTIAWLFAVTIFVSGIAALCAPAYGAAIPDLVPGNEVVRANSLNSFALDVSVFIGQGLGGTLYRFLGAPVLFLVDGISFLFAAFSESFITIPQTAASTGGGWADRLAEFRRDLVVGLRFIWERSGLRALVLMAALQGVFSVPLIVLLPFFVEDTLRVTTDWYGYLLATYSVGSVLGYLIAGVLALRGRRRANAMVAGMIFEAISYGMLAQVDATGALALALITGLFGGFTGVYITTVLQITTPSELRGRVLGLLATIAGSVTPLASGLCGVIADLTGKNVPLIFTVSAAAMLVIALVFGFNRDTRDYLSSEEPAEDAAELPLEPAATSVG